MYMRGRSAEKPRIPKRTRAGELCADRDFLRSAVHTVGSDGSERKGTLLDGGSNVREFFVDLRSGLGNLLSEVSRCHVTIPTHPLTLEASPLAFWSGDGMRLPSLGRKGGGACRT